MTAINARREGTWVNAKTLDGGTVQGSLLLTPCADGTVVQRRESSQPVSIGYRQVKLPKPKEVEYETSLKAIVLGLTDDQSNNYNNFGFEYTLFQWNNAKVRFSGGSRTSQAIRIRDRTYYRKTITDIPFNDDAVIPLRFIFGDPKTGKLDIVLPLMTATYISEVDGFDSSYGWMGDLESGRWSMAHWEVHANGTVNFHKYTESGAVPERLQGIMTFAPGGHGTQYNRFGDWRADNCYPEFWDKFGLYPGDTARPHALRDLSTRKMFRMYLGWFNIMWNDRNELVAAIKAGFSIRSKQYFCMEPKFIESKIENGVVYADSFAYGVGGAEIVQHMRRTKQKRCNGFVPIAFDDPRLVSNEGIVIIYSNVSQKR